MESGSRKNVRQGNPPPPLRTAHPAAREKNIVNAILRWINAEEGCSARKTHGGAYGGAGWPDIVAVVRGTAVMLEVKRPDGKGATDLQRAELARWHAAGAVCAVVRSVDDVKLLVEAVSSEFVEPMVLVDVGKSWDMHTCCK